MKADLAHHLADRFGTPLYAYDLDQVRARAGELREALPAGAAVFYSLKANPLPALVREARAAGCRAEVTSLGELSAARRAGFPGAELLVGGPAKSRSLLRASLLAGVTTFSCESFHDLARLSAACVEAAVDVTVLLRINPAAPPEARLAMSGVDSQFGFAEPLLFEDGAREKIFLPRLRIAGVHVYFGTQVASVEALTLNTRRALECAAKVSAALNFACSVVNVGGGFPWPYAAEAAPPGLDGLRGSLDEVWKESGLSATAALWFESGRYISAASGTLVARVEEVKQLPTRTFVILNTGIHHLGGMAGLGRVPRPGITLKNLSRPEADHEQITADVTGPLCTPLDSLARNLPMPAAAEGDLVAIPNVGAYGLTASLTAFLSHPAPVEVAHRGGRVIEALQLRTGHAAVTSSSQSPMSPMPPEVLNERLVTLLRPYLRLLPPDAPVPLDADLGAMGLDSIQSIDLLMAMEQEFKVQIPDEMINVESFSTTANLAAMVTGGMAKVPNLLLLGLYASAGL